MPSLHLLIPDAALREAVAEQLTLAKLGTVSDQGSLADALKDNEGLAIIVDEAALDKKTLLALADNDKKTVLLLGRDNKDTVPNGVTEFFAKPIRLGHLLSRLAFYIDIAPRLRGIVAEFAGLRFESQTRQISVAETGAIIRLTEKETALLAYLAQSVNPVTREELLDAIWGYDARIDTHTLESHIYQLRRKLDSEGKGGNILLNEGGTYRLNKS